MITIMKIIIIKDANIEPHTLWHGVCDDVRYNTTYLHLTIEYICVANCAQH